MFAASMNQGGWLLAGVWCSGAALLLVNLYFVLKLQRSRKKPHFPKTKLSLEAENQFFHSFMNAIPSSIYFKDKSGRIVEVNTHAIDACGMPREKLIGLDNFDFLSKEEAEAKDQEERDVMRTGIPSETEEEDQQENRWFLTTKVPRYDDNGGIIGTIVISQDITDRKLAEQQVDFERKLFRSFMDSSPDAIYFKDREGRFVEANQELADRCGVTKEELIGDWDYGTGNDEWAKQRREEELKVMETRTILRQEHQHHSRKDEWRLTTKAPWIDQNGEVIGIFGMAADITERKLAQQQAERERKFFREFMDIIPAGVYFKDRDSKFVMTNKRHFVSHGVSSDKDLIGMSDFDFFPKESAEKRRQDELEIMRTGRILKEEESAEIKWGTQWTSTTKAPRYDENGEVIGTFGISWDITDQKTAEEKLHFEHGLFKAFMNNCPDMVYFKDREGHFVEVNQAMVDLCGIPKDKLLGMSDSDHNNLEWAKARRDEELKVMESREVMRGENVDLTDHGDRWNAVIKAPWIDENNEVVGIFGMATDITDKRNAIQGMQRLSTAINQAAEIIMITDPDGTIQYVNPAFETISGYSAEEVIGETPSLLKSDKHPATFYERLWKILLSGKPWQGRIINQHKNGSLYTADGMISPVFDEQGKIENYVSVQRDISKELSLEEQSRQGQKMEAIGQLAGGIAHDFNNLLQTILGYCSMLLEQQKLASPAQYEYVEEIQKSGKRAAKLTNQLLAFSRKQPVQYKRLEMNRVVQYSQKMLTRLAGENVKFETDLQSQKPFKGDAGQMDQILINLVVNAECAMPNGGRLCIRTEDVEFSEQEAENSSEINFGSFVCLSVKDDGQGMAETVRKQIFEPFFTTKGTEGTGMGLSAVYGIVKQHSGWITVSSKPGEGSCFNIYFPICEGEAESLSFDEEKEEDLRGQGERILLVEDEPNVLKLISTALERSGYDVVATDDADKALQIFIDEDGRFDLLFSDVVLREQRGTELADQLRLRDPQLPVLLCSGYTEERVSRDNIEQGGFTFLNKPVAIVQMLKTIRKMLNEKKLRQQK